MAGAESLEEQVCAAAPFNAKELLPNHAALAALIAGFAITAFILLLDRGHDARPPPSKALDAASAERLRVQTNASLLLVLAAIVGLVSAYLFSSFTGDHCMNTQLQFHYPSTLLVVAATLAVSGLGVAAASLPAFRQIAGIIRVTVFIGGSLMLIRIAVDYLYAARIVERIRYWKLDESPADAADGSPGYSELLSNVAGQLEPTPTTRDMPGRVAEAMFLEGSDSSARTGLILIGVWFVVLTLLVWQLMLPISRRRSAIDRKPVSARAYGDP